ncbi:MAG: restriction endonuclease subunit S [Oscillospiraceae bacterium]|nr:restriction endonuclease subunit S [Oscillospiraceae bacterium]
MTKLDNLIAELCPDGVEYKPLGEIATEMYRGSGIKRDEVTETGSPCVRYGEIYTSYGVWFDTCLSRTKVGKKTFTHGDILFAITGESIEDIAKSCAYIGHDTCYAGGDIVVMKHKQNPKYLAYTLSTYEAQAQKSKGKIKSKVVHSSIPALKEIIVPLPPLPIQEEIVRILDNFTELTAELTTELTARKKQYEYYQNELLTFGDDVDYKELNEVCDYVDYRGKTPKKTDNGVFLITAKNIRKGFIDYETSKEYIAAEDYDEVMRRGKPLIGDILVTTEAPCGHVAQLERDDIALAQRVIKYRGRADVINNAYLKHILLASEFQTKLLRAATGGTVKGIKGSKLHKLTIPIPPLEVQTRIVEILDRFDTLTTDITNGLPAEITARQKQYEYYRDKLLSFPAKQQSPS